MDVCEGAVGTPILAHALRSIDPLGHTATKFCDSVFGLCQSPAVNSWKVPFPKPAPATPKAFVSTGKAPVQVVHFSDIHIDREYTVSSFLTALMKTFIEGIPAQIGCKMYQANLVSPLR